MDLTKLQGIPDNLQLSPGEQYLRRSIYIMFANANNLAMLYTDILDRFKKCLDTNELGNKYDEDILHFLLKSKIRTSELCNCYLNLINVKIRSRPLLPIINIAPSLKILGQIHTKMNKIGYQHLNILSEMTDSSDSSNTNASDSDLGSDDCVPLKKQLQTCQKAIELNCKPMMEPHIKNTTKLTDSTVHVDILIFMDEKFSTQLCEYLGLIHVEAVLKEAKFKDIDSVIYRLNNKTAMLYRLIQSYINKHLINGYNNICVVNHLSLWENINANVRAVISTHTDNKNLSFIEAVETSNIHVKLDQYPTLFLAYVESIADIVNNALNFESHVVGYYVYDDLLFHSIKLPLISIIPLYILRYFRHCKIVEENDDSD